MQSASDPELDAFVEDLVTAPSIAGVILVGSGSRWYADAYSDFDLEVYDDLSVAAEETLTRRGRVEVLRLPTAELAGKVASARDVDHWPYEQCVVLFDRGGQIAEFIDQVTFMPQHVRETRAKLHYFEFLFMARHLGRVIHRGDPMNARLTTAKAVESAVKLLFVITGHYPPLAHWSAENLSDLGVEPELLQQLDRVIAAPFAGEMEKLVSQLDRKLADAGHIWQWEKTSLTAEVGGAAFRQHRESWSAF